MFPVGKNKTITINWRLLGYIGLYRHGDINRSTQDFPFLNILMEWKWVERSSI